MEKRLTIIGWGNMGSSLGEIFASRGWKIFSYDKDKKKLARKKNIFVCKSLQEAIRSSKVILVAIKPQDISSFLKEVEVVSPSSLFISIAAGVSTKFFEKKLNVKVVRVMPNLAVKKRAAISFICGGEKAGKKDLKLVGDIFSLVGEVVFVEEKWLDKVTAISGSGPGYLYYLLHLFYKSTLSLGFKKILAKRMVEKTFWGAMKVIENSSLDFKEWFDKVASRGGTTQAAVNFWEENKMGEIIKGGIKRAVKRAKELSLK
ncbi:MAG: pyrroline-5-carboxylate reductase [Candidatus Omnitrophota bacterium]|nr:MAG: pyrroline-5-carboxylate reductase [Candidatus Omnitrophota bacterium]